MSLTKVTYSMIKDGIVNAKDFGAVGDNTTDDTAALQAAITAATNNTLFIPAGSYKITSSLTVPPHIKIVGATMRGAGPTSGGTSLNAFFAGPVLSITADSMTFSDTLIQSINVIGNSPTYGAGNGITVTNRFNTNFENMTVAGFGTNQINIGTGSYGCVLRDIYVAETYAVGTSNANIYLASEKCLIDSCASDAGKYSVYVGVGATETIINNCVLEGWSLYGAYVANSVSLDRTEIYGNYFNGTYGGTAIATESSNTHIYDNYVILGVSGTGVLCAGLSYSSQIVANTIYANTGGTAVSIDNSGYTIVANNLCDAGYGIDINTTTYPSIVESNFLKGTITPAILRSAGTRLKFLNNTMVNGSDVTADPTVVGGTPTADFWIEFTPFLTIAGSSTGITYATRGNAGYYTKIGDRVFFNINIVLTSKGSTSGSVLIEGLPFTSVNANGNESAPCLKGTSFASGVNCLQAEINPNGTTITPYKFGSGSATQLANTDLTDTTEIRISGNYLANTF